MPGNQASQIRRGLLQPIDRNDECTNIETV